MVTFLAIRVARAIVDKHVWNPFITFFILYIELGFSNMLRSVLILYLVS